MRTCALGPRETQGCGSSQEGGLPGGGDGAGEEIQEHCLHHAQEWSGANGPGSTLSPTSAHRKRPGRTVYAQMHNEKEQEMTSPVSHGQGVQSTIQGEGFIDDDLDSQTLGNARPKNPLPTLPRAPPAAPGQLSAQDPGPGGRWRCVPSI